MRARDRLFRAVLRLYPEEFRERFGRDMTDAYRDARRDAAGQGRTGVVSFWLDVAIDAFVRAPGEHMQMMLYDLRYAARGLRRSPLFALVAIVTIALGIGANTAIFSVVHAVALAPLGYDDPGRLVRIWEKNDRLNIPDFAVSVPNYVSWREQAKSFEEVGAWRTNSVTITGGEPEQLSRLEITSNLLPLLRVRPLLGRNFSPEEDRGSRVAILLESVWRRRFAGNSSLVGQPITLDGIPHVVVGIVRDAQVPSRIAQVLTPLAADLSKENRSNKMMSVAARLRPGVTLDQARQEMDAIAARLGGQYPDNRDWGVVMLTFYDWIVPEEVRSGLYLLLASVGVVLLIACSNVANLMLARAALRRRELAVRLALGASRARIVRQMLAESLLMAAAGGVGAVLLASWIVPLLRSQLASTLPRASTIELSAPVLWFCGAVAILTGLLFGVLPAALSSRRDVVGALKEGARGSVRQHGRARQILVVGQVALATVLLAAGALLVQSFQALQRVQLGFDASRLTTAMIGLPATRYPSHPKGWEFYRQLLESLAAVPGVNGVAVTSGAPFGGGNTGMPIKAVGANALGAESVQADWRIVSDDYFGTLAIPVLRGRSFQASDGAEDARLAVILSSNLARRFWPEGDPIGRQAQLGNKQTVTVVGIVGDARNVELDKQPRPTMYFTSRQLLWPTMTIVVRSAIASPLAPVIREKVAAIDPQLAIFNVRTMDTLLESNRAQPRLTAWLVGLFALLALLLAAIGVYGVLAYLVAQRTQEIGVRMALGARRQAVLRLIIGHAVRLTTVGIVIGIAAAAALGPYMKAQLYGIGPRDTTTLIAVTMGLMAIAIIASSIPALRATRVDPLIALRAE
jgi:putative ABC transport system permease protein